MGILSLFPSGRGRPSVRSFLGDLTGKLMSIEASLIRIEQQNALFAEVLTGVFQTQNTHSDMLKTLAAAAPGAIDTTELDASIAATDAVLAKLAAPASGAAASSTAGTTGTAAQVADPTAAPAAAGAEAALASDAPGSAPAGAASAA